MPGCSGDRGAVHHVELVGELVDHHVDVRVMRRGVPRDHHRSARHCFASEIIVPFVHHAVLVDLPPAHAEVSGIDHDAAPAGVPVEAKLEDRQAGLRRNCHAHRVAHLQAVGARELLLGEEKQRQPAQLRVVFGKEAQSASDAMPQCIVDRVLLQHALAPPVGEPAHGP
jgi:hypothetical protein